VSARTDAASFKQAETRTRGFFSRLRGAGAGGVEGGLSEAALQRTSRAAETLSKVVQIAAIVREGIGAFNASLEIGRGIMAGMAGDAEAFDQSMIAAGDAIKTTLLGAAGSVVGEAIFGDRADAAKIEQEVADAERRRIARLKEIIKQQQRLAAISKQAASLNVAAFQETERLRIEATGDEGEQQTHAIRVAADAKLKQISLLEREAEAMKEGEQRNAALLQLEQARERVHLNMAEAIEQADAARAKADEKRIAGVQSQIDAMRRAHDENVRTFGKEGADLEIESIKLRTEAREREIEKLVEAAETEKQRLELAQLLADVQAQGEREIAAVEPEAGPRRERVGLASAQEGLLVSGIAAAAQANQSIERQKQKTAEDTEKNTKETASVLAQLLSLWQSGGGPMPVLN
jgi:hypothetical protein